MSETVAPLVNHVRPPVPVRQWVLTLPVELRDRMGNVASVLLRAVSG